MEINKNSINDEIIEFPDNYEEISNLALLNFEKENKIDLNKLIEKGIEKEQKNINENNYIEDKVSKNEDECGDFGSDEDEEKNINANNYQKFEDDDYSEGEKENNETNKVINENKESEIIDNHIDKNAEIIQNKDNGIFKNNDEKSIKNNKEKISSNNNDKFQKKKLSNDKIREMISKIEYTPPNWARNMNEQEFINKVKLYIKYFSFK